MEDQKFDVTVSGATYHIVPDNTDPLAMRYAVFEGEAQLFTLFQSDEGAGWIVLNFKTITTSQT